MRAADTNILVRYVVNDDPKQVAAVEKFFSECTADNEPVFLPIVVLCEFVWVMDRGLGQSKAQIVDALEQLFQNAFFRIERENLVRRSLDLYRYGKASFADYVIGEVSSEAGCRDTVSFDRGLKGAPGFTIL
jgi:predicted nucleic-acid-binding protein